MGMHFEPQKHVSCIEVECHCGKKTYPVYASDNGVTFVSYHWYDFKKQHPFIDKSKTECGHEIRLHLNEVKELDALLSRISRAEHRDYRFECKSY